MFNSRQGQGQSKKNSKVIPRKVLESIHGKLPKSIIGEFCEEVLKKAIKKSLRDCMNGILE